MIRILDVVKSYDGRVVLNIPHYEFAAAGIHVLAGHNGSGKTTLMRLINGLEEPSAGKIECAIDSRDMIFCAQKPYMFDMSVQRNVEYGLSARGVSGAADAANAMMERLGIAHLANQSARQLSGGETQKAAIARALVLKPKLLLLDEPLANLDEDSRVLIEKCILEQQADGATVIIATHLLEHLYHITANVSRLENGHILPSDSVNIFEGEVVHKAGQTTMHLNHDLVMAVVTERRGQGRGILPPEDVVLARQPLESSMRNCFAAVITDLRAEREYVDVTLDIGIELTARVTAESVIELGLESGVRVYAAFKATAVKVY